jgi:hypothetical protein
MRSSCSKCRMLHNYELLFCSPTFNSSPLLITTGTQFCQQRVNLTRVLNIQSSLQIYLHVHTASYIFWLHATTGSNFSHSIRLNVGSILIHTLYIKLWGTWLFLSITGMHRIMTFRSTTDCIHSGGPIRL